MPLDGKLNYSTFFSFLEWEKGQHYSQHWQQNQEEKENQKQQSTFAFAEII